MVQKCSRLKVLEVFFEEPTRIHFIREISRKISLAQTSVRNHIRDLKKQKLIIDKNAKPFNGLVANREYQYFIDLKQAYNLYSLIELKNELIEILGPKAIILFGSYQKGEDIEKSDIDLVIVSKVKKDLRLKKYEKKLKRRIHLTFVRDVEKIDKNLKENIKNGWAIYGEI